MQENRCQLSVSAYSGFYFYIAFKILSARRLKGKYQVSILFPRLYLFHPNSMAVCQLSLTSFQSRAREADQQPAGLPLGGGSCLGGPGGTVLGQQSVRDRISHWESRTYRFLLGKGGTHMPGSRRGTNMCRHVAAAGTCPAFASTGWIKLKMLPHSSLQQHGEYKGGC